MNVVEQWFEDYETGSGRSTFGRTITEADIVLHAGQTGDFFPHHMDAEWVKTQPVGHRVAHGTLVMAVAVGMTAVDINPRAMSYGYDRIRFIKPVLIGDTIVVHATIVRTREYEKESDRFGFVDELVSVENQRGEVVLVLTHIYLVERRLSNEAGPAPKV